MAKAGCPKCGGLNERPRCPNCANDSLGAVKTLGTFYLECSRCDKIYSHARCAKCDCVIPARAFAAFGGLSPSGIVVAFVIVLVILWLATR